MSTVSALAAPASLPPPTDATVAHSSRSNLLDWVLWVLPGVIWGASYLFIAEGLETLAPDGVTFARFIIGFLALSLVPGGPTRASATTFLIPVVALLLGLLVRGERVSAVAIGGATLCLAGAWLVRWAVSSEHPPDAKSDPK
jgi:drug/metabolite transporter (DMT)-like permease